MHVPGTYYGFNRVMQKKVEFRNYSIFCMEVYKAAIVFINNIAQRSAEHQGHTSTSAIFAIIK